MIEILDLIKEVIGKSFHVVALHEGESGATFEQLIQLVRYINQSSYLECV